MKDIDFRDAAHYHNLANVYQCVGRYADAEQPCLESYRLRKTLYGEVSYGTAESLNQLSDIYFRLKRFNESEARSREVIRIVHTLANSPHGFSGCASNRLMVKAVNNLGDICAMEGRVKDAKRYYADALTICQFEDERRHAERGFCSPAMANDLLDELPSAATIKGKLEQL